MSVDTNLLTPFVSVVINNYNYAQYLREAIESVLRQTYRNFELIIVDDGSTDDSKEIIIGYHQKYPDQIIPVFKKNGGQASAFNAGYKICRGDIISFLDSDDYWMDDRLEKVVNIFKNGKYSIVQHNMEIVDENSLKLGKLYKKNLFTGDAKRLLLDFCIVDFFVPTSGVCFSKAALDKIFPIPEGWTICADAALTRNVLFYGMLYSFEQPLGFYRIHGENNFINTPLQRKSDHIPRIIEAINLHLKKEGFIERVDINKDPNYKLQNIALTPNLFEPLFGLKLTLLHPFMSFKQKLIIIMIFLKVFFLRFKNKIFLKKVI
jgi:glycosyltransferase involved in cell wall biosynthesis